MPIFHDGGRSRSTVPSDSEPQSVLYMLMLSSDAILDDFAVVVDERNTAYGRAPLEVNLKRAVYF